MVVTDLPWSSETIKPWRVAPAARSSAVKPKLRLHTDDDRTPQPLKFKKPENPSAENHADEQPSVPSSAPEKLDVEHAIEDAQRRLDDLRKLLFPDDDDSGPYAA